MNVKVAGSQHQLSCLIGFFVTTRRLKKMWLYLSGETKIMFQFHVFLFQNLNFFQSVLIALFLWAYEKQ